MRERPLPTSTRREFLHAMPQSVPQYLRDHAKRLEKRSIFLADCTMRYGSVEGLTLLSLIATDGRCDYAGLLSEARDIAAAGSAEGRPPIDLPTIAYVARVMGSRPGPGLDFTEAADLCQAVRVLMAGRPLEQGQGLPGDTDRLNAQVNLAVGRLDYVERILPDLVLADESRWMFETELLNLRHARGDVDEATWLRRFNWIFESFELAPIALQPGDGTAFDRVVPAVVPPASTAPGPLVSIVMSVFKPDQSLVTALRSLSAQTWPHLQVLVVDDCSPAEYQPMIEEAVALDERFELHRMAENGGTYKIRNYAIARARGEFIAFQDSDDWSHPERIERQIRPLIDDERRVATLSRSVRVFSNLSSNKIGYAPLRRNVSSLMLRRDAVIAELGGFDEVRKSADSEFLERMEMHYDDDRILTLPEPLALVQLTVGSLSRTDFQFGWRDGNRVAYRQAFEYWHQQVARGEESVRIEPGSPRRFPAPRALLGIPTDTPRRCDVAVISDWRDGPPRSAGAADEVRALAGAGLSVEMLHAETMRFAARPRLAPADATMQLQADGVASFARWEEPLSVAVALVRDPELLCYPRRSDTLAVTADAVVIRASYPPRSPEDGSYVYDPVAVERVALSLLGHEPVWQPATAEIAAALRADGATAPVAEPGHLGVVAGQRRAHRGVRATRPIIGTTGLDGGATRDTPSVAEMRRLLPDDDAYDVRIRDPHFAITAKRAAQGLPGNWLLSRTTELEDFLDQLDMFIGFPRRTWGPDLPQEVAVAAARGCLLVLPPEHASQLGDAAICVGESEVVGVVDRLWQDPEGFAAQQERGYRWAEQLLGPAAFRRRLSAASGVPLDDRKETS